MTKRDHNDDSDCFRGLLYGVALGLPIWMLIFAGILYWWR